MTPKTRRYAYLVASVTLLVACSSDATAPMEPRFLRVTIASDGVDIDPDGYAVVVGSRPPIAAAARDTLLVQGLGDGPVTVRLDDVRINCTVQGEPSVEARVPFIGVGSVHFDVQCIRNIGALIVNVDVSGPVGDPSGFSVGVAGISTPVTGNSAAATFPEVEGGEQTISLDGLATFCEGPESTEVMVQPATITTVDIAIQCRYSVEGRVLFSVLTPIGWRLHSAAPDGTDLVPFGDPLAFDGDQLRASVSRNGSRILFTSNGATYTIDANGTNMQPIPAAAGLTPKISPDGTQIAYSWNGEIWVAGFDGSDPAQVTSGIGFAHSPDWSPDGQRLAFEVEEASGWNLYTIGVDGTDPTPITVDSPGDDLDPAYRPDGQRLAFHSVRGSQKIVTTALDGSDLVEIVDVGWDPSWSPDGRLIAFHRDVPPVGLYVVDVESGLVTSVSAALPASRAVQSAWGPPLP